MQYVKEHLDELYLRLFNLLKEAPDFLKNLKSSEKSEDDIIADEEIAGFYVEELKKITNLRITIRKRKSVKTLSTTVPAHRYRVCIDPLDGASHYYQRGNTSGLSHVACVTVLKQNGMLSRFSDIVAGGIVELRTGDMWEARRYPLNDTKWKQNFHVFVNKKSFKTITQTKLDIKTMTIFASMHNAEDRERINRAFDDNRGMIRTHGSVATEIAYVASGQAAACISSGQSHYSQGAGYALLKGGGGVVIDFTGRDIENDIFNLRLKTPVIFAANQAIAEQVLERIHRP